MTAMGALGIDEGLMLWCRGRAFGAGDLLFGADGDFEIVVGCGGLGKDLENGDVKSPLQRGFVLRTAPAAMILANGARSDRIVLLFWASKRALTGL